jgi:hypothetical protein
MSPMLRRETLSFLPAVLVAASLACASGRAAAQQPEPVPPPPPSAPPTAPPATESVTPSAGQPAPVPPVQALLVPEPVPRDKVQRNPEDASNPADRGFLYAYEPSLPKQWQVLVLAGLGNVTRTGEERPVGGGTVVPQFGAELGLLSRLSVYAEAGIVDIQKSSSCNAQNQSCLQSPLILDTGVQVLLTNPTSRMWRVTVRPSYSYDVTEASTLNFTVTAGFYLAPGSRWKDLRVVASFMGSHTLQTGSDPVDLQATLGATYGLPLGFKIGAEAVISDLEEIVTPGAEGGSSAFAGPSVGWQWDRIQVVCGPAFGVTPGVFNNLPDGKPLDTFLFRGVLAVRLN